MPVDIMITIIEIEIIFLFFFIQHLSIIINCVEVDNINYYIEFNFTSKIDPILQTSIPFHSGHVLFKKQLKQN